MNRESVLTGAAAGGQGGAGARFLHLIDRLIRAKHRTAEIEGNPIDASGPGPLAEAGRDVSGERTQRLEVRFDGVAGCLRKGSTGGSSVQNLMIADGALVRSRRLSAREAARLMGLPDTYKLPSDYLAAYDLMGDGVVVPAVRHLAEHVLKPALQAHLQDVR
jgi:site-specific DNA-cytosine methylase